MTRHRLLALGAIGALLATGTLAGCGDQPDRMSVSHVEGTATGQRAAPDQEATGSDIVRTVAARLYGQAAATEGNLAFSPLSITTTLGMVRAGAQGRSATQLDALFAAPDGTDLHRSLGGIRSAIGTAAGPVQLADGKAGEIALDDATSVWAQSGVDWKQPFLDQLADGYGASLWQADFAAAPDAARGDINAWIADHTKGHITDLLPEGSIDDMTRMVLANALYLKAPWPEVLDEPTDAAFHTGDGRSEQVPTLSFEGSATYRTGDGWQSVTLPYAGNRLAMTFVLPDPGKLAAVERNLDAQLLAQVVGGDPTGVRVTFPSFDLDQRLPVADDLKALGVTAPFTASSDFAPMSTDPKAQPLFLADVLHQATVTVDRNGTEASAATAAIISTTSAMIPDVEVHLDRPFLFVIHDTDHGTPIFLGRVTDPTKP